MKRIMKHSPTWSECGQMSRVVPLVLTKTPELQEFHKNVIDASLLVSKYVFKNLTKYTGNAQAIGWNIVKDLKAELDKLGFIRTDQKEAVVYPVVEKYQSYFGRNDINIKSMPRVSYDKAIRVRKNMLKVNLENSTVSLYVNKPNPEDLRAKVHDITIPFTVPSYFQKWTPFLTKGSSANLGRVSKNKPVVNMRAKVDIQWMYKPITQHAIDINKRIETWIATSQPIIYNGASTQIVMRPDDIESIVQRLRDINKTVDNKNKDDLTTKERKLYRLQVAELHQEMKSLVEPIVETILENAVNNKALVCIDMSHTGTTNGSYGQDKIIKLMIQKCQNRGIPYVEVSPKWSSRRCPKCKTFFKSTKQRSKDMTTFTCPNCGEQNADILGAQNIADFGRIIWDHGTEHFMEWRDENILAAKS
jgi:RNase P subunit RPR2